MNKRILITGATDGIGYQTSLKMARYGYDLIIHGRNIAKLNHLENELKNIKKEIVIKKYIADFAKLEDVRIMTNEILEDYQYIDVIINNAGVFVVDNTVSQDGYDVRFSVNMIAPYILTKSLLPILNNKSRVVNVTSAAQMPINLEQLAAKKMFSTDEAYGQSKLGIIMWSLELASLHPNGPIVIAVNPKSFLASKMVKEAYGIDGHDVNIGANILCDASLSDQFNNANGSYYDNDYQRFSNIHPYALIKEERIKLVEFLDKLV